ncbi:MAG: hypothetical protein KA347_00630 [Bacteroidia bacterium]|nr:hypothetical protein [Bacteroidia bacterium]
MNAERNLKLFLEKGYVTSRDRKLSLLFPFYTSHIAQGVFSKISTKTGSPVDTDSKVTPSVYTGNNTVVRLIQQQFHGSTLTAIKAALVHGSIGDGNEIEYSDFDGILIIDPREIKSAKHLFELHQLIKKTELLFFEQDALQHHGWAIFLLDELRDFKDHLFPLDLIQNGKAIYPSTEITLEARISSDRDQYKILLHNLCTSIIHKASQLSTLRNQYIFKNLLSEIMLLPAAFLQAKYLKSISKKESFSKLKNDFPSIDPTILDWVSEVRLNWTQAPINFKTKVFHRSKKAGFPISFLAPKTSKNILVQLDEKWKQEVTLLCKSLLAASTFK